MVSTVIDAPRRVIAGHRLSHLRRRQVRSADPAAAFLAVEEAEDDLVTVPALHRHTPMTDVLTRARER
jgi:hypothetical protein